MAFNHAYQLVIDKLALWLKEFIVLLPNIVLAILLVVVGLLLAKFVRNLLRKLMGRFIQNNAIDRLFSSIVYILLVGVVIFSALSVLKLDKAVTSILAGAGILGLALALAFQDIAVNFMSGVFLILRRPLSVGDIVKVKEYMGKVEAINLRDLIIRTYQGQMVIIPNKDVYQNPIENYSLLGKRRMDLRVGVSYGDDLEKVKEITLEAVRDIDGLSKDEKITMFYTEFGGSSIDYVIRLWVATTEQIDFLEVKSQAIMRIKKAYEANGIMIPFPIRTLDFGIKGGVPLSEMITQPKINEEN